MRLRHLFLCLSLPLVACNVAEDSPQAPTQQSAATPEAAVQTFVDFPAPPPPVNMPTVLDPQTRRELLAAIAETGRVQKVLRGKENNGDVVLEQSSLSDQEARFQLEQAIAVLQSVSKDAVPTYALLHRIDAEGRLEAWLIGPDGGILRDRSSGIYAGLGQLAEGLGVKRLAISRSGVPRGEPLPTEEAIRAAERADRTPQAVEQRRETLDDYVEVLFPGKIRDALGSRQGRLLVIPALDTGTAPFAALPLANGYAAQNWSFVLLPDFAAFADDDPTFDFASLDIGKAVIVGDPDLRADTSFQWQPLPGARAEAKAVAAMLGVPKEQVLLGQAATRRRLVRAIEARNDTGLVYIASHAVSHSRFPLTRGYVAMAGGHYYAGHIRQESFPGWKTQPPLVVLSACQTALGRFLEGGGFGIARTWTTAGAGQVVGSLWNVSDTATQVLMTNFTSHLKAGYAPEFALQKAQIDTLNYPGPKLNFPYANDPKMWASFTVFGYPSVTGKMARNGS